MVLDSSHSFADGNIVFQCQRGRCCEMPESCNEQTKRDPCQLHCGSDCHNLGLSFGLLSLSWCGRGRRSLPLLWCPVTCWLQDKPSSLKTRPSSRRQEGGQKPQPEPHALPSPFLRTQAKKVLSRPYILTPRWASPGSKGGGGRVPPSPNPLFRILAGGMVPPGG